MIRPADSDDDKSHSDDDDGRTVAVKEDPQFTLAVTRGKTTTMHLIHPIGFIFGKRGLYLCAVT